MTSNIDDSWWSETIRLYTAQSNDATNIIETALSLSSVLSLTLAYECFQEQARIKPDVRKQLERKLEEGLESLEPDIFKSAAEVKLSSRLNGLFRLDDHIEIDKTYLTCAEYQIFIDEKKQLGEYYHPEHWASDRFLKGDAIKTISGVWDTDAEQFCQWLNQRQPLSGYRYRLPTLEEYEQDPVSEKLVGCWCETGVSRVISGISATQWQELRKALFKVSDSASAYTSNHDRMQELAGIIADVLNDVHKLATARERFRNRDLAFSRAHELACKTSIELGNVRSLDAVVKISMTFSRTLQRDFSSLPLDPIQDEIKRLIRMTSRGEIVSSKIVHRFNEIANIIKSIWERERTHERSQMHSLRNCL